MYRYIAFDVETPNCYNNRISAIGISVIENGSITDSFFSYVNPETHFDLFNTQLTGIDENTVADAPTFPELWKRIEPLLSSGILVAHNAVFDLGVLRKCLNDYEIAWKEKALYCCTVQMGRQLLPGIKHGLGHMCDYYGIYLDHHKADSDIAVCILAAGYILVSSLIIFNVEPDTFDSFFMVLYWTTVSLTTVGYGDIYPVSFAGRLLAMISSVFGIAIVALPAGIITADYLSELKGKEELDKKGIDEKEDDTSE